MPYTYFVIDGYKYRSIIPTTFEDYKYLRKRIKSVKEKIRAYKNGTTGTSYKNYEKLLEHLEQIK